jgi:hypothetical protein
VRFGEPIHPSYPARVSEDLEDKGSICRLPLLRLHRLHGIRGKSQGNEAESSDEVDNFYECTENHCHGDTPQGTCNGFSMILSIAIYT